MGITSTRAAPTTPINSPIAFDRSRDQLWEEGDEGEEGNRVTRRFHLAEVDVERVAHRLECVEADPDRKYETEAGQVRLHAEKDQHVGEGIDEEVDPGGNEGRHGAG